MDTTKRSRDAPAKRRVTDGIMCALCKKGTLWSMCDEYIAHCSPSRESEAKSKRSGRFPNLAGFCRYVGTGFEDLSRLKEKYPKQYDRLLAIFEDEALNSDVSTTLLSAYMKRRLCFGAEDEQKDRVSSDREITYCFEHDIYADGE